VRHAFVLLFAATLGWAQLAAAQVAVTVTEVPSLATATSLGAALTSAPDGQPWLSWVELGAGAMPAAAHEHHSITPKTSTVNTLRFATFDAANNTWTPARTIVTDATVTSNSADFPQLAIDGRSRIYAVWSDGAGGAFMTQSRDAGATWSKPSPWAPAGIEVEKFSFTRLAGGDVLAAWLDGRGRKAGGTSQQLFARVLRAGAPEADQLVDASVCDCCQTALISFLDGGALVAYRGRTGNDIRDIHVARWQAGGWSETRVLNPDNWHITGCPVNGPRIASDGSRVGAAWFTGADGDARVLASYSPDAGQRWLAPIRVDRGHPVGHVDTVLLRDGAVIVTWLEADGSLWLRRITPEFAATESVALAPAHAATVRGVPRVLLQRDYAGGRSAAQLLLAFTAEGSRSGIHTLLVTIPEGDFLAAERNCDCAPTAEELEGFPLRGAIVAVRPGDNRVLVQHDEVPGVFAAGQHDFEVTATTLATLRTGAELLGRIHRAENGTWQLAHVQLLGAAERRN
jgi:hypothetical protein